MLEMSSGRVDCVVNALELGLTAIAKNLQDFADAVGCWHDFLSMWVDYNRGIGQMREWFIKGLALSGAKPEDVPVELNV